MRLIILILSIYVFIETVGYGIFEQKANKNKVSAIIIYILSIIVLVAPNVLIFIR